MRNHVLVILLLALLPAVISAQAPQEPLTAKFVQEHDAGPTVKLCYYERGQDMWAKAVLRKYPCDATMVVEGPPLPREQRPMARKARSTPRMATLVGEIRINKRKRCTYESLGARYTREIAEHASCPLSVMIGQP